MARATPFVFGDEGSIELQIFIFPDQRSFRVAVSSSVKWVSCSETIPRGLVLSFIMFQTSVHLSIPPGPRRPRMFRVPMAVVARFLKFALPMLAIGGMAIGWNMRSRASSALMGLLSCSGTRVSFDDKFRLEAILVADDSVGECCLCPLFCGDEEFGALAVIFCRGEGWRPPSDDGVRISLPSALGAPAIVPAFSSGT